MKQQYYLKLLWNMDQQFFMSHSFFVPRHIILFLSTTNRRRKKKAKKDGKSQKAIETETDKTDRDEIHWLGEGCDLTDDVLADQVDASDNKCTTHTFP